VEGLAVDLDKTFAAISVCQPFVASVFVLCGGYSEPM
jgi:hypothetical protein